MKIEVEVYPCHWVEIDPCDLYDGEMVSLATHLERGTVRVELLDGTCWSTWDFTQPVKEIRVVQEQDLC